MLGKTMSRVGDGGLGCGFGMAWRFGCWNLTRGF